MANSAKRDSNGTWHIQFRYTDWTGTQRKSSRKGFKSKKEAEEWLSHFMAQQAPDPTILFSDFWEIYKADMSSRIKLTGASDYYFEQNKYNRAPGYKQELFFKQEEKIIEYF